MFNGDRKRIARRSQAMRRQRDAVRRDAAVAGDHGARAVARGADAISGVLPPRQRQAALLGFQRTVGNARTAALVSRSAHESAPPDLSHSPGEDIARTAAGGTIQRKEVTIDGEQVEVHSILGVVTRRGKAEQEEAANIIKTLKDTYGVEVSSSKLLEGIKQQYTKVPEKVTKALKTRKWRMDELRALATALKHYAPILGKARESSTRAGSEQEVVAVGKGAQAIDTNTKAGKLDTTTLGEYFAGKKVMGMFKASEGYHDVFPNEKDELVGTFVHEIAHGLLAYAYDDFVKSSGGYWLDQVTKSGAKDAETPPTEYGKKNAREDMCDTASLYFIAPGRLAKYPKRLAFMEKLGKDWVPALKDAPPELGGAGKEGEEAKPEPVATP